jgi:hypothetical protein
MDTSRYLPPTATSVSLPICKMLISCKMRVVLNMLSRQQLAAGCSCKAHMITEHKAAFFVHVGDNAA